MQEEEKYTRKIIHVDMDAFYASVEQRDNPDLRGKPVAVGWDASRGVVAAASYEARKYGVRSAMSSVQAKRLCSDLIFVRSRFDLYKEISRHIRSVFFEYTDLVEPLSLDEAFLDVTRNKLGLPSATLIAKEIRKRIWEETRLTASAGVSFNKFLAKLASDMNKPNGMKVIKPGEEAELLKNLQVDKFYGIGPNTAERMHAYGLHTGGDLRRQSITSLTRMFGKQGEYYYNICRGIDDRDVNPERERKSVGTERTYEKDLITNFERVAELYRLAVELMERLREVGFKGKTLTLKIKFHNHEQHTHSHTDSRYFDNFDFLLQKAKKLLAGMSLERRSIRLMGLTVSNPISGERPVQLTIDF
ncbi:MAG: DNA polymerase IV [Prevotellaceae bacterium]|jgi:DNA polymerase-4|nr:DNA polymerase IV [Prevotellaceae bacterium]